jgi:nucleoside-diphosphate-sugar epimerase
VRVVVTGAAGFIGSHLVERLLASGHDVVGIDGFTDYYARSAKERNLEQARADERFTFMSVDLAEDDLSGALEGADFVYHLAGRPGVRAALMQFDQYWRENVVATQRLLEAARGTKIKKLVYAGSSSVYGDAEVFPTAETALPAPLSPYGVTKLAGEHLAYVYWKNFGVPAVRLRYFSVYGPRMRPDLMLAKAMRAAYDGTVFDVYGDGEQTREFTYVTDAVDGTILAGQRGAAGDLYNLGGGSSVTVNHVLDLLAEVSGRAIERRHVERQPGDHRRAGASITRARIQLGWEPRTPLREGLAAQWRWFEETMGPREGLTGSSGSAARR